MNDVKETGGAVSHAGQGVSRPELERLAALRRTPCLDRDLTPPGGQSVVALQESRRENRVRYIEARLAAQDGRAVTDFALGQQRDVARKAFDRGDRGR